MKSFNALVLYGIVLGLLFGIFLPEIALQQQVLGQLFVSLLKMLVVPLVFSSIYLAIAGLGSAEHLKQIGLRTVGLYLLTTALSTLLAIAAMNIFSIGEVTKSEGLIYEKADTIPEFSFSDMLLSFVPSNIFSSMTEGAMMPVIVFSIIFALASFSLQTHYKNTLLNFFGAVNDNMLKMAEWVIKLTPIGVFSLISYVVASQGIEAIFGLWQYMLLVIAVLLIHALITLPTLMTLFARINPFSYLKKIKEVPLMAFSTASSAATLPVSIEVAETKGGVSTKTAGFVLPLGATVSMDGTAAYLSIAILYIANLSGVPLSFGDQLFMGITVVALSVGVAALPSASLVMMVIILNQLSLPVEYIALIVAVDRILDMCRTSLNVTSDMMVSKIVDVIQRKKDALLEKSAHV